jgi:hypothetical protein
MHDEEEGQSGKTGKLHAHWYMVILFQTNAASALYSLPHSQFETRYIAYEYWIVVMMIGLGLDNTMLDTQVERTLYFS